MDDFNARLAKVKQHIKQFKSFEAKEDLNRMVKAIERELDLLNREEVECRRLHKITARYQTINDKIEMLLGNLEKQTTFARLRYS